MRARPDSGCDLRRRQRRALSAYQLCERITEAIVCGVVVFNPWAFGTTQPWSIWAMNIAGYVLGGLLAAKWLLRLGTGCQPARWLTPVMADSSPGSRRRESALISPSAGECADCRRRLPIWFLNRRWLVPVMAVLTVVFLGYVLVSAVNARAAIHADQFDIDYFDCILWLPHSYDRPATWFFFWEYLGLACTFWAVRDWLGGMTEDELRANDSVGGRTAQDGRLEGQGDRAGGERMPARLKRVLMVLCLSGTLVGLEGIVQRAAGSNKLLFFVQPRINQDTVGQFGPYANRNNAAEYFNLVWPVCAGLACVCALAAKRARREGVRNAWNGHWLLAAGAVVMGACPFVSSSRGGSLVASGLALATLVALLIVPRAVSVGGKIGLGLLFAGALQIAVIFGWDILQERFESVFTDELSGRLTEYKNAKQMLKDSPWFGSGAGTFERLYYFYRSDPSEEWSPYAHDDWLETRITLGWTGLGLLLALLAGAFGHWYLGDGVPLPRLLAVMLWLALIGGLIHARFDFPLRVHSIATVFVLYCSILSCSSRCRPPLGALC